MKKIIVLLLASMLLFSTVFAETDVKSMSDDELKSLIQLCANELREWHTTDEGVLLFEEGGMRLYQTGEATISSNGRIKIPVVVCNDLELSASLNPVNVACNGFTIQGYCGSVVQPKSKMITELDFATGDLALKSLEDVDSLIFGWSIYSLEKPGTVLEPTERTEQRFW